VALHRSLQIAWECRHSRNEEWLQQFATLPVVKSIFVEMRCFITGEPKGTRIELWADLCLFNIELCVPKCFCQYSELRSNVNFTLWSCHGVCRCVLNTLCFIQPILRLHLNALVKILCD